MGLFSKEKKLFGNNIVPYCKYCANGIVASDDAIILCDKKGVVSPDFSCNKYIYAPTKRIPKRQMKLPTVSLEDFKL